MLPSDAVKWCKYFQKLLSEYGFAIDFWQLHEALMLARTREDCRKAIYAAIIR